MCILNRFLFLGKSKNFIQTFHGNRSGHLILYGAYRYMRTKKDPHPRMMIKIDAQNVKTWRPRYHTPTISRIEIFSNWLENCCAQCVVMCASICTWVCTSISTFSAILALYVGSVGSFFSPISLLDAFCLAGEWFSSNCNKNNNSNNWQSFRMDLCGVCVCVSFSILLLWLSTWHHKSEYTMRQWSNKSAYQ